ncbi:hypothetical protein [Paenibacillus endoradicis]|uniref:hypothetical protein n=1 Tax=Paenibacillus endoradicis TaxID=2972487 RepID=UPI002159A87D|nr:hypothetical protein [Paenibacillus endoradicis]MCR8656682.1 hypothetical protein [Paenibacillus endoradicis]
MKSIISLMLLFLLFLSACGINKSFSPLSDTSVLIIDTEDANIDNVDLHELHSLPDLIDLTFSSLEMKELQEGEVATDWKYMKSISFGEIENSNAVLEIYEITDSSEILLNQINGVLKFNNKQFLIIDLSRTLIENDSNICPQVCMFQHYFSNQNRYQLIGTVDISLNGPGLRKYLVYDNTTSKILDFDLWGEPSFIDLDADGNEEFIIQFQGLHLSLPDLSIIRTMNGELEISDSVFNSIQKNQGDFANLNIDTNPPFITISNFENENGKIYNYSYNEGILKKVKSKEDLGS